MAQVQDLDSESEPDAEEETPAEPLICQSQEESPNADQRTSNT